MLFSLLRPLLLASFMFSVIMAWGGAVYLLWVSFSSMFWAPFGVVCGSFVFVWVFVFVRSGWVFVCSGFWARACLAACSGLVWGLARGSFVWDVVLITSPRNLRVVNKGLVRNDKPPASPQRNNSDLWILSQAHRK